ncbi:MAG: CPBP family intramembrane metalloprotease [Puniceicoccales bacterium]|nr:CPBP family intramembrane metalloprotease [Puniceicoccales bacterium]
MEGSIFFRRELVSWQSILCLYIGSLLLAALLVPPLIRLLLLWNLRMPNGAISHLLSKNFGVIFDRLHLFFFALMLGVKGLRARRTAELWASVREGLRLWRGSQIALFWKFFAIGVMMDLCLMGLQMACFPFRLMPWTPKLAGWALCYGLSAGCIALLEEIFFRGCLLGSLLRPLRERWAIFASALIFAGAHFGISHSSWDLAPEAVTMGSGFRALYEHVFGVFQNASPLPLAILFFLGLVLAQLALRHHSLAPAMGLHAGLVWMLMLYKKAVDVALNSPHPFLGTWRLTDAPATLYLLLLMAYCLRRLGRRGEKNVRAD